MSTARNAVNSFLVTNMALVLTQCRWRSRLFALIVILRSAAAHILARDMVIVSRWIMSEMNTSDAPGRLQEQHQPQDQVRHVTDEQTQSGACLARACEKSASNETNQSACSMSKSNTVPPALPYSTSGYRDDGYAGGKQALSGRAMIAMERLEGDHARLCCWEKGMRQMQTQEAVSDATTENEAETIPRRQRTLSDEAARRRRLLVCRMANDAAANGMNLLQH